MYFTYCPVPIYKIISGDFYSPESDPPHKIMRYWVYYSTQFCSVCISFEKAFWRGRPLNIWGGRFILNLKNSDQTKGRTQGTRTPY